MKKSLLGLVFVFFSTSVVFPEDNINNRNESLAEYVSRPNVAIALMVLFGPSIIISIKDFINMHINTLVGRIKIRGFIGNTTPWLNQILEFEKDPSIKGIFLDIDCGGGLPGSSEEIYRELKRVKSKKPIVAYIRNMCCSGAYYIASVSNCIVAEKCAEVGNIGVRTSVTHYDNPKLYDMAFGGISGSMVESKGEVETMHAGQYKAAGHDPFKDMTSDERAYVQNGLDSMYDTFCSDVAEGRGLDINNRDEWADGKVFNGNASKEVGLVDYFGSITDAKMIMHEFIKKLNGGKARGHIIFVDKKPTSLITLLSDAEMMFDKSTDFVAEVVKKVTQNTTFRQPMM